MKAKTCNDIFEKAIDYYHINNEIDSSYPNPFEKQRFCQSRSTEPYTPCRQDLPGM